MLASKKPIPYSKNGNKPRHIYALVDPRDSRIRYVGCAYEPNKRIVHHIYEAKYKREWKGYVERPERIPPRLQWLNELDDIGEKPIVVTIEKCQYREWRERENHWIEKLYEAGAELTNVRTAAGYDNIDHDNYYPIRKRRNSSKALRTMRIVFTDTGVKLVEFTPTN